MTTELGGVDQLTTLVVGAVATTAVMMVKGPPLLPPPPAPGEDGLSTQGPGKLVLHLLGGPLVMAGQGGRVSVLAVATPFPLVTV